MRRRGEIASSRGEVCGRDLWRSPCAVQSETGAAVRTSWGWPWSRGSPKRDASPRLRLDKRRRTALIDGERIELTSREFSLLEVLVRREGEICTRQELVVDVWGATMAERTDVVDAYVARLRAKLGDDVVETVQGAGYRVRPSPLGPRAGPLQTPPSSRRRRGPAPAEKRVNTE